MYGFHFFFFQGGYFGFDDIEYCRLADSLLKGEYTHGSLYAHRYASILPLVIAYFILGVNDLANFIAGFSVFICTLYLVQKSIEDLNPMSRWMAALLLIFAPMYLMYIEKPMPDIIVALGFLVSFLSCFSLRFEINIFRNHTVWFCIGIIIVFLAKETFLIFYPYFIILMIIDIYYKKNLKFWKDVVLAMTFFVFLYCAYYWIFAGDPFARIQHIMAGQYVSACSYDLQPFAVTLQRIAYQLWLELSRNLYLLPLCFVPYLWTNGDIRSRFITKSYLALLLLANFMTISYTSYVPLCPDPRHHIYILPLAALVAAYGVKDIHKFSLVQFSLSMSILGILLLLHVFQAFESSWWLYIPIMLGLFAGYYRRPYFMILLFFIGFMSVFIQNCTYNKKVNYANQKLLNEFVIHQIPGFKYVITDRVNHDYGLLHSQFENESGKFVEYKSLDTFGFRSDVPKYLIINGMTTYLSNTSWDNLPEFVKTAHEKLPKVYENQSGTVYKVE